MKVVVPLRVPGLSGFFVWAGRDPRREASQCRGERQIMEKETGVVKWFNDRKGYGFIARDGKDDIFVHYSDIAGDGFRTLNEGDRVEFTVKQGQKGLAAGEVIRLQSA